jgi:hypothetical protein
MLDETLQPEAYNDNCHPKGSFMSAAVRQATGPSVVGLLLL